MIRPAATMFDSLFSILSLLYLFWGVQIAAAAYRNRAAIQSEAFTPELRHLADRASFFLAVPVAVFFHELAHAAAIWAFGGRVLEFGYRAFWGFVAHQGAYTPAESWFIAIAGTLASLLTGLAFWLVLRGHQAPTVRYFGRRAFRFQIYFSLIYYPLFTLLGFYGDWRTIYDFGATPLLSGATLFGHALGLLLFWRADRAGWFSGAVAPSAADQQRLSELQAEAAASPQDAAAQLRVAAALLSQGRPSQARAAVEQTLKQHPNSAEAHLLQAVLDASAGGHVSARTRDHAAEALSLGLPGPKNVAQAHQILGQYELAHNHPERAAEAFSQGLAAARADGASPLVARLHHALAHAYRRGRRYDDAFQQIGEAIRLAEAAGDEQAAAFYRFELETIEHHAGRRNPLGL